MLFDQNIFCVFCCFASNFIVNLYTFILYVERIINICNFPEDCHIIKYSLLVNLVFNQTAKSGGKSKFFNFFLNVEMSY